MARKTSKENTHDFTRQIHSTRRTQNIDYVPIANWDERKAMEQKRVACRDCRKFYGFNGCFKLIGRWHMPCEEFEWD